MADTGQYSTACDQEREPDWLRYLNHQGDWLEKTRGNLMVVATVIASMSFQVMVNPPGGVWQDDQCAGDQSGQQSKPPVCTRRAGTSVLEHGTKRAAYLGAVISSTVSFSASLSLILLVISGLRLRNRCVMAILIVLMVAAVLCMVAAFAFSVALVQSDDQIVAWVLLVYVVFWVVFPTIIVLIQLVRFVVWVLCLVFCCCIPKRRPVQRLRPQLPDRVGPSARECPAH